MKMKKYSYAIFLWLFIVISGCTLSTRDFKKAKGLVFYPPQGGLAVYTDKETLGLLKRAKRSYNTHLWKSDYKALVIMNSNDTVELRVSPFGGFFRKATNNNTYVFKKQSDIDQWTKLIGRRLY